MSSFSEELSKTTICNDDFMVETVAQKVDAI